MISLITVEHPYHDYLSYFLKSAKKLTLVSEIIVCKTQKPSDYFVKKDKVLEIGSYFHKTRPKDPSHEHAFALHHILNLPPKNDLVFISDPDIFFYTNVDEFYYELMEKHNLNSIGVARNNPQMYVQDYFPAIFNILLRQSSLPKNFIDVNIDGQIYTDKFFAFSMEWRDMPPEQFGGKKGWYDTGCLLYLWAKQNNWRWLSFLTGDVHNYSTQFYRAEPKIQDRLTRKKLLYHQSMSGHPDAFNQYQERYKEND